MVFTAKRREVFLEGNEDQCLKSIVQRSNLMLLHELCNVSTSPSFPSLLRQLNHQLLPCESSISKMTELVGWIDDPLRWVHSLMLKDSFDN